MIASKRELLVYVFFCLFTPSDGYLIKTSCSIAEISVLRKMEANEQSMEWKLETSLLFNKTEYF